MTGPNQFDWTKFEEELKKSAALGRHSIPRFFVYYPGQPLRIPQFLLDQGLSLVTLQNGQKSPKYDDPKFLTAVQSFIGAFGKQYDGDKRIFLIQLGLLGYVSNK